MKKTVSMRNQCDVAVILYPTKKVNHFNYMSQVNHTHTAHTNEKYIHIHFEWDFHEWNSIEVPQQQQQQLEGCEF